MRLPSFGLMAIAVTRPLSCRPPCEIGLGPMGDQTVPVSVMPAARRRGLRLPSRPPAPPEAAWARRAPLREALLVGLGRRWASTLEAAFDVLAVDPDGVRIGVAEPGPAPRAAPLPTLGILGAFGWFAAVGRFVRIVVFPLSRHQCPLR